MFYLAFPHEFFFFLFVNQGAELEAILEEFLAYRQKKKMWTGVKFAVLNKTNTLSKSFARNPITGVVDFI